MPLDQAAAFFLFALVAAGTPGPSNALLTAVGAQAGLRRGLPCLVGVAAGMASLLLAMALGLGGVLLAEMRLVLAVKLAGAAFLLWLAWTIATAPVAPAAAGSSQGDRQGDAQRRAGFWTAALLQWVNPKAWMVSAGAAATYLQPAHNPGPDAALPQALALAAVFVAAALPAGFAWLAFGAAMQSLLATPRRRRAFNVAMGAALAASVALVLA